MTNDDDFQQIMEWDSKVVGAKTRLGGFCFAYILLHFPPKKALLLSSGKGKFKLFFPFFFFIFI